MSNIRNCADCVYAATSSFATPCVSCTFINNHFVPKSKEKEKNMIDYGKTAYGQPANYSEPVSDTDNTVNSDHYNTGLDQKKDHFTAFTKLISNQFMHGGSKYKLKGDKEFTDAICEAFPGTSGVDWVLGTCMKYLGRYKNFGREKDLLKIATYMYLLWLKGGFHLNKEHDEDVKKEG